MPTGYDEDEIGADSHNLSFLLTLLTMLDFQEPGSVTREDWERGIAALHAPGLSHEVSWSVLLNRFDLDASGSIDFGEMHGLAPLDPRLASLLRVITQTLVRLSERINGAYAGLHETKLKAMKNTINQWRDKCIHVAFSGWKHYTQKVNASRNAVIANLRYAPCRKCLHAMHELVSTKKAQMARAASMIRGGDFRLLQRVVDAWRESHFGDQRAKSLKLMGYFMGRDLWWKQHIVETWHRHARHERAIRRFAVSWLFAGMAKTFVAWRRHTRAAVADRTRGLSKGMAMLTRGTEVKCFRAWRHAARAQVDERDAVLRKQLMRKTAMFGAQYIRAWFDWFTERKAAKLRVTWKLSCAGKAFRAWYVIIDDKRRHEFLSWAFGSNMEVLRANLGAVTAEMRSELEADAAAIREEVAVHTQKLRQEAALERKAVRESLATKPDTNDHEATKAELEAAQQEIVALREQLASQKAAQEAQAEEAQQAAERLTQQLLALSREVDDRVAQTRRQIDSLATGTDVAVNHTNEQLQRMQQSKANHDELLSLVQKLQHRPKPGHPVGVTPLLTVPYPLPPGQAISSSPRRPAASRPTSAAAHGSGSQSRLGGAEYREVPSLLDEAGGQAYLNTTEQILVRHLPSDAEGGVPLSQPLGGAGGSRGRIGARVLVPPSSHTPTLSARASATAHAIVAAKRPASARAGGRANVDMFSQRTERLERSLGCDKLTEPTMPGLV